MMDIRPISDLTNHYSEIEELVAKQNKPIYLTKNGYGSMVLLSLKKYESLMKELDTEEVLERKFASIDIQKLLDEMDDEIMYENTKFLRHEEIFSNLRRKINNE